MIRSRILWPLLLTLQLLCMSEASASLKVEALEAWPPGDAVSLSTQDRYYVHIAYESERPAGFWVSAYYRGEQVMDVGSSPSTRYLGKGETMVWLFPSEPGVEIDELRIRAGSARDNSVQAVWPVRISAVAGAKSSQSLPAWIAEMELRQQQAKAMNHVDSADAGIGVFAGLLSMLLVLSALALGIFGLVMPFFAIRRWRNAWQVAAALPLVGLALVVLNIVFGVMVDPTSHNLFPFEILIAGAVSGGWMLLLLLLRWLTGRRQQRGA